MVVHVWCLLGHLLHIINVCSFALHEYIDLLHLTLKMRGYKDSRSTNSIYACRGNTSITVVDSQSNVVCLFIDTQLKECRMHMEVTVIPCRSVLLFCVVLCWMWEVNSLTDFITSELWPWPNLKRTSYLEIFENLNARVWEREFE